MSKDKYDSKLVNRHKRMAAGEKIELKEGGKVDKKSKPKKK
jgi:hypothetical protein